MIRNRDARRGARTGSPRYIIPFPPGHGGSGGYYFWDFEREDLHVDR